MSDYIKDMFIEVREKDETISPLTELEQMIEEVSKVLYGATMLNEDETIEEGERFSMSIPIPKLNPNEAWGNPDSQSRKERLLHPNYFDFQSFSTPRHVRPKCRLGQRALDVTNQNKGCEEAFVPPFQTLDGHRSIVMVTHKKFRKEALHKPFSGVRGYGSGRRGVKDA